MSHDFHSEPIIEVRCITEFLFITSSGAENINILFAGNYYFASRIVALYFYRYLIVFFAKKVITQVDSHAQPRTRRECHQKLLQLLFGVLFSDSCAKFHC